MRILIITHEDLAASPVRAESRLTQGLIARSEASVVEWEALRTPTMSAACDLAGVPAPMFDVCLFFVRFKSLREAPAFDWGTFEGLRVWLEEDAWLSYSPAHPGYRGAFVPVYVKQGFDLMVSSGREVTERLRSEGVNAKWVAKGYSSDVFRDLGIPREGVCTFGTRWHSRRALAQYLDRRGVPVSDVSGPFDTLNERLNAHVGGLVCNMTAAPPFGRAGRLVARYRPTAVRLYPGVEPMSKLFEVAAAGCAPIVDSLDELPELGFVDRKNCLVYRTFAEAAELIESVAEDEMRRIGQAASRLAYERHSWDDRAQELCDLLSREIS